MVGGPEETEGTNFNVGIGSSWDGKTEKEGS